MSFGDQNNTPQLSNEALALKMTREMNLSHLGAGMLEAIRYGSQKGLSNADIAALARNNDLELKEELIAKNGFLSPEEQKSVSDEQLHFLINHIQHEEGEKISAKQHAAEEEAKAEIVTDQILYTTALMDDAYDDTYYGSWEDERIKVDEFVPMNPEELAAEEARMEGIAGTIAGPISPDDLDAIAESQGFNKDKFAAIVEKKAEDQAAANPTNSLGLNIIVKENTDPEFLEHKAALLNPQGLDQPEAPKPEFAPVAPQPTQNSPRMGMMG